MKKNRGLLPVLCALACLLWGCAAPGEAGDAERTAIDYTVMEPGKLPEELRQAIEENKEGEIRMTYMDGEDLYLVRGYGKQKTGGYSIAVAECAQDEETIVFDTRLLGPDSQENLSGEPSYPCLVVKIEARDKEVMIK